MHFDLYDLSGNQHRFTMIDIRRPLNPVPGLYAFLRWTGGYYHCLYIGQAINLQKRLPNHERWSDALEKGMTHVCAMAYHGSEEQRLDLERSFIKRYSPPLNNHHASDYPALLNYLDWFGKQ